MFICNRAVRIIPKACALRKTIPIQSSLKFCSSSSSKDDPCAPKPQKAKEESPKAETKTSSSDPCGRSDQVKPYLMDSPSKTGEKFDPCGRSKAATKTDTAKPPAQDDNDPCKHLKTFDPCVKKTESSSAKGDKDPCKPTGSSEKPEKKTEEQTAKKEDVDPCKSTGTFDPCGKKKEDQPAKKEDQAKKKDDDPCKSSGTFDPCGKKKGDQPAKKDDDPCKSSSTFDPCGKKKSDQPDQKKDDDPCKSSGTFDPCGKKKEETSKKDDNGGKKKEDEDPCKSKSTFDPCEKKNEQQPTKTEEKGPSKSDPCETGKGGAKPEDKSPPKKKDPCEGIIRPCKVEKSSETADKSSKGIGPCDTPDNKTEKLKCTPIKIVLVKSAEAKEKLEANTKTTTDSSEPKLTTVTICREKEGIDSAQLKAVPFDGKDKYDSDICKTGDTSSTKPCPPNTCTRDNKGKKDSPCIIPEKFKIESDSKKAVDKASLSDVPGILQKIARAIVDTIRSLTQTKDKPPKVATEAKSVKFSSRPPCVEDYMRIRNEPTRLDPKTVLAPPQEACRTRPFDGGCTIEVEGSLDVSPLTKVPEEFLKLRRFAI